MCKETVISERNTFPYNITIEPIKTNEFSEYNCSLKHEKYQGRVYLQCVLNKSEAIWSLIEYTCGKQ